MFRFARCWTGHVAPEGKGEFHPVGHEEISLAGRGHTDWGSIEEIPLAYKNIDRVMQPQETLVEVQGKFMPRIVRMNKE